MSADTDATVEAGTPVIRLDVARHSRLFAAIGCTSVSKIAAATGVTEKTVYRARQGILGEEFMAKTVATLRRHAPQLRKKGIEPPKLDDLFNVTTKRRESRRVA